MNDSAAVFESSLPQWANLLDFDRGIAIVDVSPMFASGRPGKLYTLEVVLGERLSVREQVPGTSIPKFCTERHINGDMSFCLGLERFELSSRSLPEFWEKLRAYLLCQQFADQHGVWPTGRGLSHGDAAYSQLKAEALAEAAGLKKSYRRALEFGKGRLADNTSDLTLCLLNRDLAERPRLLALRELLSAEVERRREENTFLAWCKSRNIPCCETMKVCPMRDRDNTKIGAENAFSR